MARRRRRNRQSSYLDRFGYPSPGQLRREASTYAQASLPTRKSIMRQYGQSIDDVGGFTRALVSLLRGPGTDTGYDQALASQQSMDAAGQARLAGLGIDPAAAATLGSFGRSTGTELASSAAAEEAFSRRQPGIAGSRGALAQTGLVKARGEALDERAEAYRGAFQQALQQVRQNALAMASFNANQFNADRSFQQQQAAADVQASQFNRSMAWQREQFYAGLRAEDRQAAAGGGDLSQYTPSQITNFMDDAASTIDLAKNGIENPKYDPTMPQGPNNRRYSVAPNPTGRQMGGNVPDAPELFRHMIRHGIPSQIALQALQGQYSQTRMELTTRSVFGQQWQKVMKELYPGWKWNKPTGSTFGIGGVFGNRGGVRGGSPSRFEWPSGQHTGTSWVYGGRT